MLTVRTVPAKPGRRGRALRARQCGLAREGQPMQRRYRPCAWSVRQSRHAVGEKEADLQRTTNIDKWKKEKKKSERKSTREQSGISVVTRRRERI